ncbi:ROK family transcriptional regulator (plasmid) [Streptomyces sp. BI20]|uniref:ROK family transcriptional regulator n=1 Tax=Streptomyces sp. BI20 TaxID=3403460 RepID=UPI003C76410A
MTERSRPPRPRPCPPGDLPDGPVRGRGAGRRTDLGLVLRALRDRGPRTRAGLAADTRLPKPTITGLVAELVALGLVAEGEARREAGVGRPGTLLHLDGRHLCGLGLEIGTGWVRLLARTPTGDTPVDVRRPAPLATSGPGAALDLAADTLREALDALERHGVRPVGLVVAVPGIVDTGRGVARYAPALGWREVPVAAGLRARLADLAPDALPDPVVENDAKLTALAEYALVREEGVHDMVSLTGERGVGAGIVSGGRLLHGAGGFAGEVGHLPLDPRGRPCVCGRTGCWERAVGLDAVLRLTDPGAEPALRLAETRRRAEAGDPEVLAVLAEVADDLGRGIAVLAGVLDPALVVLGGWFADIGDLMLERVREVARAGIVAPDAAGCEIRLSTLGFTAAARGGGDLALARVLDDPTSLRTPSRPGATGSG